MTYITLKQALKNHFNITKDSDLRLTLKDFLKIDWILLCSAYGTKTTLPEVIAMEFVRNNIDFAYERLQNVIEQLNH
jgi:hypothetical protein